MHRIGTGLPVLFALSLFATGWTRADFDYPDSFAPPNLNLVGDAFTTNEEILRLTPSAMDARGAAPHVEPKLVQGSFETESSFPIDNAGGLSTARPPARR